ncbi:MAG: hypothetical protein GC185_03775 [Alphaproteobacteria bacterium]|nr:hypothetical protein [Alphaproteobacteria bacterium]
MSNLGAVFYGTAAPETDFRKLCDRPLGNSEKSPYADKYSCLVDLGFEDESDVLPYAVVIWDKKTDRFAVAFPHELDSAQHRLKVHFFHEGYKPVEDSSAFKPAQAVVDALPALDGKEFSLSHDRIIDNMSHAQLKAVIAGATRLNEGRKEIHDMEKKLRQDLGRVVNDAFLPRQEPAPAAVATEKPAAPKKAAPRKKPRRKPSAGQSPK